VPNVVADLVNQPAVRVADLGDVRRIDHHLSPIHDGGLSLVHGFRGRPQIVVAFGRHREHAREGPRHPDDVQLLGELSSRLERRQVIAPHIPCSSSPSSAMATHSTSAGTSSAARWITRRTGVSRTPIVAMLVQSAPSQCVKSMISAPAMPGNMYFAPPE